MMVYSHPFAGLWWSTYEGNTNDASRRSCFANKGDFFIFFVKNNAFVENMGSCTFPIYNLSSPFWFCAFYTNLCHLIFLFSASNFITGFGKFCFANIWYDSTTVVWYSHGTCLSAFMLRRKKAIPYRDLRHFYARALLKLVEKASFIKRTGQSPIAEWSLKSFRANLTIAKAGPAQRCFKMGTCEFAWMQF